MGRSQRHLREFQGGDSSDWPGVGTAVNITSPTAGAVDLTVTLTCTATNEDGGDAANFVTWSSNVDGELGMGNNFTATLSAGAHTITADCGGTTDTVAVTAS